MFQFTTFRSVARAAIAATAAALLAAVALPAAHAQTCPFDDGNSSLAVEGVVLTRYALGITGAPLVASTGINALDAPTVEAAINCPSCGLNITGNPTMTVADATIISRKLAGFSGPALTNGVALGSGTRNTVAAVNSFLLSGCGTTGGTVTSVTAGAGLTGGTITASGTIAADTAYLQRRIATACSAGSFVTAVAADGTPTCAAPPASGGTGTVTRVGAGYGLVANGPNVVGNAVVSNGLIELANGYILPQGCTVGQVPKSAGAGAWSCGTDNVGAGLPACSTGQVLRFGVGGALSCANLPNTITTVDGTTSAGEATSIAVPADGLPVISFTGTTDPSPLRVAKCADVSCSLSSVVSVDNNAGYTSIAVSADGLPVIAYSDNVAGDLKVAKCGNAACSNGNSIVIVDAVGEVGKYLSIAVPADGLPVISYYDFTNGRLKVAKCGSAACSTGNTITTVDSSPNVGRYTAIAVPADGLPIISYIDNNSRLKVAKCGNASCSSGNTLTTVDTATVADLQTSIAISADGLPVISYLVAVSGSVSLKVAKCSNASCSSGTSLVVVDAATATGAFSSIAVPADGRPIISYFDFTNGDLRVAKCGNAACSSGNTLTTLDSAGDVGRYTSIKVPADGLPVVSYFDSTNSRLKVLKCSNASCLKP